MEKNGDSNKCFHGLGKSLFLIASASPSTAWLHLSHTMTEYNGNKLLISAQHVNELLYSKTKIITTKHKTQVISHTKYTQLTPRLKKHNKTPHKQQPFWKEIFLTLHEKTHKKHLTYYRSLKKRKPNRCLRPYSWRLHTCEKKKHHISMMNIYELLHATPLSKQLYILTPSTFTRLHIINQTGLYAKNSASPGALVGALERRRHQLLSLTKIKHSISRSKEERNGKHKKQ